MNFNYKITGSSNQTILLLHYFGGSSKSWFPVTKKLSKTYRVVAVTLPGFGNTAPFEEISIYSFAKHINKLIDHLGLKDYIVCGHSMSAKLLLYAAQIKTVNSAKALVLICPSPPTIEEMTDEDRENMAKLPDAESAVKSVAKATITKLKNKRYTTAISTPLKVEKKTWKWWVDEGMLNDISDRIGMVDAPMYVICSKNDPIIPIESIYKEVLPYLKQPKLIELGGSGHLLPLEKPRKLSRYIKRIAKAHL